MPTKSSTLFVETAPRAVRTLTKYATLFVVIALLAAFLQGCGRGKGGKPEACSLKKALEGVQFNRRKWKLSDFRNEGCVLKINMPDWLSDFDENDFDSYWKKGDVLSWEKVDGVMLKNGEKNSVHLECQDLNLIVLLSADTSHLIELHPQKRDRASLPSTCRVPLFHKINGAFGASLIQQLAANSTNLQGGPDLNLHKANDTQEIITAQGETLKAKKAAKSSQPVYRMHQMAVEVATFRKNVTRHSKLAP